MGSEPRGPEPELCSWCGAAVEVGEGYRVAALGDKRGAVFCRLEHVVPWAIQGARWDQGTTREPLADVPGLCSECGAQVGEEGIVLVRRRGEHRIPDAFCSVEHALAWAKAGGRWR
jgi:hypothetical protein